MQKVRGSGFADYSPMGTLARLGSLSFDSAVPWASSRRRASAAGSGRVALNSIRAAIVLQVSCPLPGYGLSLESAIADYADGNELGIQGILRRLLSSSALALWASGSRCEAR